ncbi:MAG: hypothetical protein OEN02_12600 [Gammaproteobacteria bacterium]|nr:hypothetical protein [Gammaproteobacteria bacterium]
MRTLTAIALVLTLSGCATYFENIERAAYARELGRAKAQQEYQQNYQQEYYSPGQCIGSVINGKCHGTVMGQPAGTCHGQMLHGQCIGADFPNYGHVE